MHARGRHCKLLLVGARGALRSDWQKWDSAKYFESPDLFAHQLAKTKSLAETVLQPQLRQPLQMCKFFQDAFRTQELF
jgi:hypothetical protein